MCGEITCLQCLELFRSTVQGFRDSNSLKHSCSDRHHARRQTYEVKHGRRTSYRNTALLAAKRQSRWDPLARSQNK